MKFKLAIISLMLLALPALADDAALAKKIASGNAAYKSANYEEAKLKYADAQVDSPDCAVAAYDAGLALYRLQSYEEAIKSFERAAVQGDEEMQAKCHYNMGNCLFRQGKLKEALESYKRANELKRDDEDTKLNIEYLTRLMKELASKEKEKQEQDPLRKLLQELEKLIRAQNMTNVKTGKALASGDAIPPQFLDGLLTNQNSHVKKSLEIKLGFQALLTNLPPERLMSTGEGQDGQAKGLEQTPENEGLMSLMQAYAGLFERLNQLQSSKQLSLDVLLSMTNQVMAAQSLCDGLTKQNVSSRLTDLASRSAEGFGNFLEIVQDPSLLTNESLNETFKKIGSVGEEIQQEIKQRLEAANGPREELKVTQGPNGESITNLVRKATLAMKITNAVHYMELGHAAAEKAASQVMADIKNIGTNQFVALDNFIKARKEFDEDQDKNDQKQQQNQNQDKNDNQNKDQQDQQDKQDQQDQKDQQDQQDQQGQQDQQNQDQNQNQNQQNQDQNQDQQQQDQQQGKQQKPNEMTPEQAEAMLRSFEEDQKSKDKDRPKVPGQVIPVDKNW